MKRNMKVIFIIAVLFIIGVGLFGIIKDRRKIGNSISYSSTQLEEGTLKQDSIQSRTSKSLDSATVQEKTVQDEAAQQEQLNTQDSVIEEKKIKQEEKTEKEQYISRLDSIKDYYSELWDKSDGYDMTSMKQLKNQEYTKWDDELNTIYQLIKKKLPEKEFITLRDAERVWIKDRDKAAESAASEYAGGTMEGLEYMAVMTDQTRERTYALVEIYFEE